MDFGDLEELAHCTASKYTKQYDINNALKYFVELVKQGRTPNKYVMLFIAEGIERHLENKEPWPLKRGRRQDLTDCFKCLYEYELLAGKSPKRGDGGKYGVVAEKLEIDESTVKRRVRAGREAIKRFTGATEFIYWYKINNLTGADHIHPGLTYREEEA